MPFLLRWLFTFLGYFHLIRANLLQNLHLPLQGFPPLFKQTTHNPHHFAHRRILHSTVVELIIIIGHPTSCESFVRLVSFL